MCTVYRSYINYGCARTCRASVSGLAIFPVGNENYDTGLRSVVLLRDVCVCIFHSFFFSGIVFLAQCNFHESVAVWTAVSEHACFFCRFCCCCCKCRLPPGNKNVNNLYSFSTGAFWGDRLIKYRRKRNILWCILWLRAAPFSSKGHSFKGERYLSG